MGWARWKFAERQTAELLGGTRRIRITYSESVEDVIHDKYAVEVKQGKQIPLYCRVLSPVAYYYPDGTVYVVFPSKYLWMLEENCYLPLKRKCCKFIEAGLSQAHSYDPKKVPLLAMKSPNMSGVVFAMYYLDWMNPESLGHPQ